MSLVLGDHQRIKKRDGKIVTIFIVLVDMIPNGCRVIATGNIDVKNIETNIVGSNRPVRLRLELTSEYDWLILIVNDHRDPLGNVYFMSCDFPEGDGRHSLWNRVDWESNEDVQSGPGRTLFLHMGDNSYNDEAYNRARRGADARNAYRQRYRRTWFCTRARREVYSKGSHLMFCDDHEVKNNLTYDDVPENERYIYDDAMVVYTEYQENLQIYNSPSINRGWKRSFGDDAIITFERSNGIPNTADVIFSIRSFLDSYPSKGLIVSTGWAPIPSPSGNHSANIYRALFGTGKFLDNEDLILLYSYLLSVVRDGTAVLLIGGDIHFGVSGIVSNGTNSFIAAAASAITNHPTMDRKLASSGYQGAISLNDVIQFTPVISRGSRCYAKLVINHEMEGVDRYILNMRYSRDIFPQNPLRYINTLRKMR
jgi:hypothetical protein